MRTPSLLAAFTLVATISLVGCSGDLAIPSGLLPQVTALPTATTVIHEPAPTVTIVAKKFKNCASLTKVLPHGVGKPGAKDKVSRGVEPVTDFLADAEFYRLNKHLDRDGDGIACETL